MLEKLIEDIRDHLPEIELSEIENSNPSGISIHAKDLLAVCEFLHTNDQYYFDHLSSLSGVDLGTDKNQMEVVYHLYSIPFDKHLVLKVVLNREKPEVDSLTPIWRGANWHERETFDLYGIHFNGHPDLRRILLPADWVGYPMRKDYEEESQYHGMTIKHPDLLKDEDADV